MPNFSASYLGQLRALVGSRLVLMPGAQVVVMDDDGCVLMQRRADSGEWEFPSGAAEPGQSFTDIAIAELAEEAGINATAHDLEPFATLSDPAITTLHYPNGHEVQAFAMCFLMRVSERPVPCGVDGEAYEHSWCTQAQIPEPTDETALAVLARLRTYLECGGFIAQ